MNTKQSTFGQAVWHSFTGVWYFLKAHPLVFLVTLVCWVLGNFCTGQLGAISNANTTDPSQVLFSFLGWIINVIFLYGFVYGYLFKYILTHFAPNVSYSVDLTPSRFINFLGLSIVRVLIIACVVTMFYVVGIVAAVSIQHLNQPFTQLTQFFSANRMLGAPLFFEIGIFWLVISVIAMVLVAQALTVFYEVMILRDQLSFSQTFKLAWLYIVSCSWRMTVPMVLPIVGVLTVYNAVTLAAVSLIPKTLFVSHYFPNGLAGIVAFVCSSAGTVFYLIWGAYYRVIMHDHIHYRSQLQLKLWRTRLAHDSVAAKLPVIIKTDDDAAN